MALLCHLLGQRYGPAVGLFASLSLLTMPRLMGHAHLIGTDTSLLFFWTLTALAFRHALASRRWQWILAGCWAGLFLVKFSGVVIAFPLGIWFLLSVVIRQPWPILKRWLVWSTVLVVPLTPVVVTLLVGVQPAGPGLAAGIARFGIGHPRLVGLLFFWPLMVLAVFWYRQSRDEPWDIGLELPWIAIAITPLLCILLNPTWWHETLIELARYFSLNIHRRENLPDIGIFYLGKRYLYSLPWHNAFVLMGVTIPWAALVLGLWGSILSVARWRSGDRLPAYLLLQALTLPVFRMFNTPAHDGVRLFLPTFFFWAGLAGIAAGWLVERARQYSSRGPLWAWVVLFAVGPGWAGCQWARIHPYELSYYNLGLRRAMDWGFEPTYWYDALTPSVLQEINEKLPPDLTVSVHVDPLINPETFFALQSLGRLRGDIKLNPATAKGFGWVWLLTHSSKATPFTRLLYACPPWHESGVFGIRLFSVVDEDSIALAWSLWLLTIDRDTSPVAGVPTLNEAAFSGNLAAIRQAFELIEQHGGDAGRTAGELSQDTRFWVERWTKTGQIKPALERVLRHKPQAMQKAITILATRPQDVRRVLEYPGYLRPERFGGYFYTAPPAEDAGSE